MHQFVKSYKYLNKLIKSPERPDDCIPVVVLKNCGPELSYILAELCNMCLKQSCFPDCWKVSLVVPVFKNVGERSTAKNYHPISLLSIVSKVFEKLVKVIYLALLHLFTVIDDLGWEASTRISS